ncbi:MAG: hypothetical protein KAH30_02010 [Caldisericia bacterium]|nr:hypothetical protein [Caldisericia bacterium]
MKKIVAVALIGALLLTAGLVSAAQIDIWGRVESVDVDAKQITVWNGQMGEFTVSVEDGTSITVDGETATISDIIVPSNITGTAEKIDDTTYKGIELKLDNTNCPVGAVPGSMVGGRVTSVDSANRTFELFSGRAGAFTVKLADDAVLIENGVEIKITDVEVNDMIRFVADEQSDGTYLASSGTVNDTSRGGRPGDGKGRGGDKGGRGRGCEGGCGRN